MTQRGYFITLEGGDGSGKSTLTRQLADKLVQAHITAVTTREPGGTAGGEEIRQILVKGQVLRWDPMSEVLLLSAARRHLLETFIKPHVAAGHWVFCDRFVDSTLAYQGYGGGVSLNFIKSLYASISENFYPDVTFLLDIAPEVGLARSLHRLSGEEDAESRYERMSLAFHQKIRQGYLELARDNPERYVVVEADKEPARLLEECLDVLKRRFQVSL